MELLKFNTLKYNPHKKDSVIIRTHDGTLIEFDLNDQKNKILINKRLDNNYASGRKIIDKKDSVIVIKDKQPIPISIFHVYKDKVEEAMDDLKQLSIYMEKRFGNDFFGKEKDE